MTSEIDSIIYVPEKLREFELYPKIQAMLNYIMEGYFTEIEDVRYKYRGPDIVRDEVIQEIINELGFKYISNVMQTITNYEFNILLEFLGLINLLKGSKEGLQLVLKLLGFEAIISEWWELNPVGVPYTFIITIIMDGSFIQDPVLTLNKVKDFIREYVFPTIQNIDFQFNFNFAQKNVNFGGFWKAKYSGSIIGTT
jgi:hypothetical protein